MRFIFKYFWITALLFSVFLLAGAKIKPVGRFFLYRNLIDDHNYGNLYNFCKIKDFKTAAFQKNTVPPASDLDAADIISFGDSFFNTAYDSEIFAQEFEKCSPLKMVNVPRDSSAKYWDVPATYLKHHGYRKGAKKYLLLESVDTYSLRRGLTYQQYEVQWEQQFKSESSVAKIKQLKKKIFNNPVANLLFESYDIEFFFRENFLVYPLCEFLNTMNFHLTGQLDSRVAAYSTQPAMLFYDESVQFDQRIKTGDELEKMADDIASMAAELQQRYNIELIYLIIPNKYTIYHGRTTTNYHYDAYIPRIYALLSRRGVKTIDILQDYQHQTPASSDLLYYPGDTHYNKRGKQMLVQKCARYFASLHTTEKGKKLSINLQ